MNSCLLTFISSCLTAFIFAQTPPVEWTKAIGGIGNERTNSVETDPKGNIILVGRFQSPSITVDQITLTKNKADNPDVADIFILKLDRNGKALWAVTAGEKGDDHATSCVTDKKGNIYVVGWFESKTISFGTIALTKKGEKGSDMYVAKFSPKGKCLWAQSAGGNGGNGDYSTISLDKDNNVVLSGMMEKDMYFGNNIHLTSEADGIYVAKYSSDGDLLWAKSPKGKGQAQGVGTDPNGNVFVGGFFVSTISFDGLELHSTTPENGDAFVAKYAPDGNVLWAKNIGGEDGEIASCESDPFGNVYLAGLFFSKIVATEKGQLTNNGMINSFIAKYDANGKLLWIKSTGGNNGEGPATVTREFYIDDHGKAFCTGSNWSSFSFAGKTIQPVAESEDILLLKYDQNGNELWGVDYGGSGRNAGRGITTDKKDNIFLTGSFDEKALKIGQFTLNNAGDSDIFLVKYGRIIN